MAYGCVLAASRPHRDPGQSSTPSGALSVLLSRFLRGRRMVFWSGVDICFSPTCLFLATPPIAYISSGSSLSYPERAHAICRRHLLGKEASNGGYLCVTSSASRKNYRLFECPEELKPAPCSSSNTHFTARGQLLGRRPPVGGAYVARGQCSTPAFTYAHTR